MAKNPPSPISAQPSPSNNYPKTASQILRRPEQIEMTYEGSLNQQIQSQTAEPSAPKRSRFLGILFGSSIIVLIISSTGLFLIFDRFQYFWSHTTKEPANIVKAQPQSLSPPKAAAVITDQVEQTAMAPERVSPIENISPSVKIATVEPPKPKRVSQSISVQLIAGEAALYSGPGSEYSIIGKATDQSTYPVVDWSDRWFKIILQEQGPLQTYGWIRNDLVRITPPNVDTLR